MDADVEPVTDTTSCKSNTVDITQSLPDGSAICTNKFLVSVLYHKLPLL